MALLVSTDNRERCITGLTRKALLQLIISTAPVAQDEEDLPADSEIREVQITSALHGLRLDKALAEGVPEFSRSYLQQLIGQGDLSVSGQVQTKAAGKVRLGQVLRLVMRPTPQSQAFVPEPMDLQVVFEDEHLRVIHKPAGLVVHPAPGNWRGTLLNGLLALDPAVSALPRAGIVHRLDKDTSGLMVVARTRQAMDALVQRIAARVVKRQYLAIGQGRWGSVIEREVTAGIGRDPQSRLRMAAVDLQRQAGKEARTTITCLDQNDSHCLVLCSLHTGRTHQIRVHMAYLGHSLVGDALYGGVPSAGLARQALHAWKLAFEHPITGQELAFEASPPADIEQALQLLGLRYN